MGLCMQGEIFLFINLATLLDDFFVNQNQYLTKSERLARIYTHFIGRSITIKDTFDKTYDQTRKGLASAFFKSKLDQINQITKQQTIAFIKEHQQLQTKEIDLVKFV